MTKTNTTQGDATMYYTIEKREDDGTVWEVGRFKTAAERDALWAKEIRRRSDSYKFQTRDGVE